MQPLPKIIAVVGPTASGKTALGTSLAQQFQGEIVSADAKQVYRGMDIGTAKEKNLPVPQHLIDIKNPGEKITVAEYQQLAYAVIDDLLSRRVLPFLVGGSGLYAESVLSGYLFSEGKKSTAQQPRYASLKLGIQVDRLQLKEKAAERLRQRVKAGLAEEVRDLLQAGISPEWMISCGLEYKYFTQHVQGKITEEEAIHLTTTAINQFIKRQYTWWRRHPDVHWVDGPEVAASLVRKFLKQ